MSYKRGDIRTAYLTIKIDSQNMKLNGYQAGLPSELVLVMGSLITGLTVSSGTALAKHANRVQGVEVSMYIPDSIRWKTLKFQKISDYLFT